MSVPNRQAAPEKIKASEKARKALALRQQGMSFREIAERVGYKEESGARKAVSALLKRVEFEDVGEYRKLMLLRLEELYKYTAVSLYDTQKKRVSLFAIDRALAIIDQTARLVGAYDAIKMEISHSVDWRNELDQAGINAGEIFEQLVQNIADYSGGNAKDDR